jgi:DNA-binding GntR family transcriptional regulator
MVTERLRDSIVDGTLEPGSQLSEVDLAHGYGVSRGPVREAIQRLLQEGLLRSVPHRGVYVPVLTDVDVVDVYLARAALESAALRLLIATSTSQSSYEILDKHVFEMEAAASRCDWETVGRFDLEFHTALVATTGSQRLQRMFATLISETRLCLAALTGVEAREDIVTEHRKICDGILDGDTERALVALEKHNDAAILALTTTQRRGGAEDMDGR